MSKFRSFIATGLLGVMLSTGAFAATPTDQINGAIGTGDFAGVEAIVATNPSVNDVAVEALLRYVKTNLADSPMKAVQAAEAMDVAVRLGPKVTPANAKPVADLVKEITDQALIGCTSLSSKTTDTSKAKNAKAISAIQNAAEAMAQLPVLVAANPQLATQVRGENATCMNGDEAQLFQTPAFSRPTIPNTSGGGGPPNQPPTGSLPSGE